MSDTSLFEMEWKDFNKEDNLNIDPLSLFKEIEQEVSEKLIEEKATEAQKMGL